MILQLAVTGGTISNSNIIIAIKSTRMSEMWLDKTILNSHLLIICQRWWKYQEPKKTKRRTTANGYWVWIIRNLEPITWRSLEAKCGKIRNKLPEVFLQEQVVKEASHLYRNFQSMTYFDRFLGRILNRFSKDIGMIDDMMPMILCDVLQVKFIICVLTWVLCKDC